MNKRLYILQRDLCVIESYCYVFQVGFHSGTDGQYYLLDHSGTDAIINITLGSNVDVAGKYIFRIDGETIDDLHCAASGEYL